MSQVVDSCWLPRALPLSSQLRCVSNTCRALQSVVRLSWIRPPYFFSSFASCLLQSAAPQNFLPVTQKNREGTRVGEEGTGEGVYGMTNQKRAGLCLLVCGTKMSKLFDLRVQDWTSSGQRKREHEQQWPHAREAAACARVNDSFWLLVCVFYSPPACTLALTLNQCARGWIFARKDKGSAHRSHHLHVCLFF